MANYNKASTSKQFISDEAVEPEILESTQTDSDGAAAACSGSIPDLQSVQNPQSPKESCNQINRK